MSVLEGFLEKIKLNDEGALYDNPYDEEEYEEEEERRYDMRRSNDIQEDEDVVTPIRQRQQSRQEVPMERYDERPRKNLSAGSANSAIRSMQQGPGNRQKKGGAQSMEICSIKPTSMDDTREVTNTLLQNRAVILNLEGLDFEVAQRIVDFVSGSCFAIKGNLQKISRFIFIITPHNVDVSGDFLETVGAGLSATTGQNN